MKERIDIIAIGHVAWDAVVDATIRAEHKHGFALPRH